MRDQNGPSLAAALRAHGHPVPFLFMSGYAEDSFGEPEALGPDVNFISKPFTISGLRSAVAQTLARHSNSPRNSDGLVCFAALRLWRSKRRCSHDECSSASYRRQARDAQPARCDPISVPEDVNSTKAESPCRH